ncbi:transcription regulator [Prunus dulcis]|uniref:Transcription regulator n=1 Tax=Prunus dulcis TaxID=3755 RepID=A0A4Y1RR82_PRUDU|nr:transcription regulator [Prunus dulcis]
MRGHTQARRWNFDYPKSITSGYSGNLRKGFLINVLSDKNSPGLLVSILEAFEELGLDVLDARVSCSDTFQLEAVGGENQGQADSIDAHVVKQAVLQAIQNWSQSSEQD